MPVSRLQVYDSSRCTPEVCFVSASIPISLFNTACQKGDMSFPLCKSEWNVSFPWKHIFYLYRPDEGYSLSVIVISRSDMRAHEKAIPHAQASHPESVHVLHTLTHKTHKKPSARQE